MNLKKRLTQKVTDSGKSYKDIFNKYLDDEAQANFCAELFKNEGYLISSVNDTDLDVLYRVGIAPRSAQESAPVGTKYVICRFGEVAEDFDDYKDVSFYKTINEALKNFDLSLVE